MFTVGIYLLAVTVPLLAREIPKDNTTLSRPDDSKKSLISFTKYATTEEIDEYLKQIVDNYPDLTSLKRVGTSVEGRPLTAMIISSRPGDDRPVIFIDAGIHAREWIAPAAALYIIHQLVENYAINNQTTDLVDWVIFPLVNPDGYSYSMTKDRLWRKNRANTTDPQCRGVDLNRNFDVAFGGRGTSFDPCEEIYAGPNPFSEPESQAIKKIAYDFYPRIKLYLTLHSYGKFILYPWGFEFFLPKDWKDLQSMATKAAKSIFSVYGTKYQTGSSGRLMGAAAGGSDDWVKDKANIKYSYTIELPGGGMDGFDLPPESILPAVTELFSAIRTFSQEIDTIERTKQEDEAEE